MTSLFYRARARARRKKSVIQDSFTPVVRHNITVGGVRERSSCPGKEEVKREKERSPRQSTVKRKLANSVSEFNIWITKGEMSLVPVCQDLNLGLLDEWCALNQRDFS